MLRISSFLSTRIKAGDPLLFSLEWMPQGRESFYTVVEKEAKAIVSKARENGEIFSLVNISSSLQIDDLSCLCWTKQTTPVKQLTIENVQWCTFHVFFWKVKLHTRVYENEFKTFIHVAANATTAFALPKIIPLPTHDEENKEFIKRKQKSETTCFIMP